MSKRAFDDAAASESSLLLVSTASLILSLVSPVRMHWFTKLDTGVAITFVCHVMSLQEKSLTTVSPESGTGTKCQQSGEGPPLLL